MLETLRLTQQPKQKIIPRSAEAPQGGRLSTNSWRIVSRCVAAPIVSPSATKSASMPP